MHTYIQKSKTSYCQDGLHLVLLVPLVSKVFLKPVHSFEGSQVIICVLYQKVLFRFSKQLVKMPSPLQSVILIVCLLTNGVFFVKHLQTWVRSQIYKLIFLVAYFLSFVIQGKPATYLALIDLHKSDESLIKAIRQVIIPPPSPLLPYNFTQV